MRYLIKIAYDGSKYNGFQRLKEGKSVQRDIEKALTVINKSKVEIKGAGRTDRGVHALSQMAHFDLSVDIPANRLKNAINSLVSNYIYIEDCQEVDTNFHSRFDVKEKTYEYKINLGEYSPLLEDYYLQISDKLDIKKMKKASKCFKGIHDFENFVSGKRKDYTAIIYDIKFLKKKNILIIRFRGKSFYRYMVRNLVGALLDVGTNKVTINNIRDSVNKISNKKYSTALAKGLYLVDIKY